MIIESLHLKPRREGEHGIPKPSVPRLLVTSDGVSGDYNHYRQKRLKGDPDQAVLLHCVETLEALTGEGWPVAGGDLGENLLLRGVPYDALRPGVRVRAGEVVMVVTKAAKPCKNLAVLPYVGDERLKAFIRTLRDRRGWYARVTQGGTLAVGDAVVTTGGDA